MAYAQAPISFRQLSVQDGLSQSNGVSMAQDRDGYLWIGTLDGLNKYDGNEFTVYKKFFWAQYSDKGYAHIGKVYADREGHLWIIPVEKVPQRYNAEQDTFESLDSLEEVSCMYQDEQYNLWFGTYGRGLYRLDKKSQQLHQVLDEKYRPVHIHHITGDRHGNIIASGLHHVFTIHIDQDDVQVTEEMPIQDDQPIYYSVAASDEKGNMWLGTYLYGLLFKSAQDSSYQNAASLNLSGDPLPEQFAVMDILIDSRNRMWVGSYGQGLYMIDLNTWSAQHFESNKYDPFSIHYNDIDCIYEDRAGTIWFGTDGAGLSYYDEYLNKFSAITTANFSSDVPVDVIRAITKEESDVLWLGTYGDGLTRYDLSDGTWKNYKPVPGVSHSIGSDRVVSLLMDDEDELWVGTQYPGGLSIMSHDGIFRRIGENTIPALKTEAVWCIFSDGKQQKWLGTIDAGLILFDKERGVVRHYATDNSSIPSNNIRVISEGSQGVLWLGTEGEGICSFNPETEEFTSYTTTSDDNSLSGNSIKSLYYDGARNLLWVGTYGNGLCVFDENRHIFYRYNTSDGLANDVIYGILPDASGSLWLSSNKGITRFTPGASFEEKPQIFNYSNYDIVDTEFNTGAYVRDINGVLYFGGMEGVYWINPSTIQQNNIKPETAITQVLVFGKPIQLTKQAELTYKQNTLSFSFSGFQFSMPRKTTYQYKLENHDTDWITAAHYQVRYTNLPPGSYRFVVKAANYDGMWDADPAVFSFIIQPPWYASKAAWIAYGVLVLLLLYMAYRYLRWHFRLQYQLVFNRKEADRLRYIHDFKARFYTNISHEIRTPLTLISGPVQKQLSKPDLSTYDREDMEMIRRNADRMLQMVDQLLELSKLESGFVKLKVAEGDVAELLRIVATSFDFRARQKDVSFHQVVPEQLVIWFDYDIVEKVLYNLLSNAVKYTPDGGRISFSASREGNDLLLQFVNTTAVSYTDNDLDHIFGRFFQGNHEADGAGIGLSLVKELVTLSHGSITVRMSGASEIEFSVRIPAERRFYREEEIYTEQKTDDDDQAWVKNGSVVRAGEKPVLLIMDDHDDIRKFVRSILDHEYTILEAGNGEEGIQQAVEHIPDVIISDVMMPFKTGIEVCNTLKYDERTSHIPIMLLTAKAGEESEIEGLKTGADDYMVKPFNSEKLILRVRNLVESRRLLRNKYSQQVVLKPGDIAVTSTDEKFLVRLRQALDDHLTDSSLNAESFSKLVGMSRMQLHRKLTALTGLSTTAFLKSERCKLALIMLTKSDATVSEVAYSTGFNSPSYFIRSFKEIYGVAPLEYMKRKDNGHDSPGDGGSS